MMIYTIVEVFNTPAQVFKQVQLMVNLTLLGAGVKRGIMNGIFPLLTEFSLIKFLGVDTEIPFFYFYHS